MVGMNDPFQLLMLYTQLMLVQLVLTGACRSAALWNDARTGAYGDAGNEAGETGGNAVYSTALGTETGSTGADGDAGQSSVYGSSAGIFVLRNEE